MMMMMMMGQTTVVHNAMQKENMNDVSRVSLDTGYIIIFLCSWYYSNRGNIPVL